jgi:DNA-binding response OmpR family regulator
MKKAKILVVDDDVGFAESVRTLLESRDFAVCLAHNRNDGLNRMRSDKPDLLVLDVMMTSWLDGLDMAKELKEDAELCRIPILMLTGVCEKTGRDFKPTPGGPDWCAADVYLSKPVAPDVLLPQIEAMLSDEWVGAAARRVSYSP